MNSDPFRALLDRAESGDSEAARELFEDYGRHVLRAVRHTLNARLRQLFDSQDLVQSVWKSIFENKDSLGTFESPEAMIAFLTTVARRKVAYKVRRYLGKTQKTNMNRVTSLDQMEAPIAFADRRERAPDETAEWRDHWDNLVGGLSDRDQRILELRRDGLTNPEITDTLSVSERTIQRVINRASERFQEV